MKYLIFILFLSIFIFCQTRALYVDRDNTDSSHDASDEKSGDSDTTHLSADDNNLDDLSNDFADEDMYEYAPDSDDAIDSTADDFADSDGDTDDTDENVDNDDNKNDDKNDTNLKSLRINGGTLVTATASFVVSLGLPDDRCVGTFLNSKTILTAAHCVFNQRPADIKIKAGVNNLNLPGVTSAISAIHPHPNFTSQLNRNDIAILKLATALTTMMTLPLPSATEDPKSATCYALGWGPIMPELKRVKLNYISEADCRKNQIIAPRLQAGTINLDNKICAMSDDFWRGTEPGDSGGPFACLMGNNYKIFGVASENALDTDIDWKVSVYIDVRKYLTWINSLL